MKIYFVKGFKCDKIAQISLKMALLIDSFFVAWHADRSVSCCNTIAVGHALACIHLSPCHLTPRIRTLITQHVVILQLKTFDFRNNNAMSNSCFYLEKISLLDKNELYFEGEKKHGIVFAWLYPSLPTSCRPFACQNRVTRCNRWPGFQLERPGMQRKDGGAT